MTQTAPSSRLAAYDAAFARDMQALQLASNSVFITALSGGPDSTALACLADRYARSCGAAHQAIIVNHNIRSDAADEAERVCQRMLARAIATQIVTVQDKAPSTGIQEWARHQRFAALTKQARQQRAVLLLAHHQADQAETVLMRLARGSGIAGLAAMRALTHRDAVPVARPVLNWSADQLRDVLALLHCDYEDDPSNQNYDFERVRVRRFLRKGAAYGFPTITAVQRLGQTMAALSDHCAAASAPIWEAATDLFPSGHAVIDMSRLHKLPDSMWQHHARRLIQQVGGHRYGVSATALDRLRVRLLAAQNSTVGGCQFARSMQVGETARVFVVREIGRVPREYDVTAGDDVIFAGCWRVRTALAGQLLNAGTALQLKRTTAAAPPPDVIATLPYIVRRVIPVLCTLDGGLIYPQLVGVKSSVTSTDTVLSAQFLGR
ncbi:MAG: tRNA lysidine(34) synthetase TilS [Bacteroidetes bacterium]|nr:tRNA lysidine(34) synthetase TilS [Bacteroidota bacterium]